jgi:hypothetical protein
MKGSKLAGKEVIACRQISSTKFDSIQQALDGLRSEFQFSAEEVLINFTGGNKLMAAAVFEWARFRGFKSFYLERGNCLVSFDPALSSTGSKCVLATIDPAVTNHLDALDLLKCQLGAATVRKNGERLVLSKNGLNADAGQIQEEIRKSFSVNQSKTDFSTYLDGVVFNRDEAEGLNMEYAAATLLLKTGIPVVYRSIEMHSKKLERFAEGELDLVFNWKGRLWIVDCKDKASGRQKIRNLRAAIAKSTSVSRTIENNLAALEKELVDKDIKVIREDLLQASEVAGLLGSTICVRASVLPPHVAEFAKVRKIHVVYKDDMLAAFGKLLQ